MSLGRDGFGEVVGDVLLGKEQLPLQVMELDEIPVDDPDTPHSCAHQRARTTVPSAPQPTTTAKLAPSFR